MKRDEEVQRLERAHARYKRMKELHAEGKQNSQEYIDLWKESYQSLNLSDVCPTCGRPRQGV